MDTLGLLFTLGVLLYSLYSAGVYLIRRRGDRQALRIHKDLSSPSRGLTADEQSALQPFLVNPAKSLQAACLSREGVFLLDGPYVRHGLSTSQGGETLHDTIDGVEVVLPYDARDFVAEHCRAEVVFTDKVAIVIGLDGGFDLLGGRERTRLRERREQQWQGGVAGTIADIPADPTDEAGPSESAAMHAALQAQILSQRDETAGEIAARSSPGAGLLPALCFLLGFAGVGIASEVSAPERLFWLVPGLIGWLAGLLLVWRRRDAGAARKVNRVRGQLNAIVLPVNGQIDPTAGQLFIGDKFALHVPDHWRPYMLRGRTGPVDVEMRVDDHYAVAFDHRLSIDEEVRRWPPMFWGRHLTLAAVGLFTALGLVLIGSGVRSDLLLSWAWLRHGQSLSFSSVAALAASPPTVGSIVQLSGTGRCEVRPGAGVPRIDCARVRWGGAMPGSTAPAPDELTRVLYSGAFLHARSDPVLDTIAQLQYSGRGGDASRLLGRYRAAIDSPKIVSHLATLVKSIRSACAPIEGAPPDSAARLRSRCETLQRSVADALNTAEDPPRNWDAWLALAETGALVGKPDQVLLQGSAVANITHLARELATIRIDILQSQMEQDILKTQRDGVVLQVWPDEGIVMPGREEVAGDALGTWVQLAALTTPISLRDFSVEGLVTRTGREAAGGLVLEIDAGRSLNDPAPSLLRSLNLAVALLLFALHGSLFFTTIRGAMRRLRGLHATNEQQMQRAAFGG